MFRKLLIVALSLFVLQQVYAQKNKKEHAFSLFAIVDGKKVFYNEIGAPLPPVSIYRRDGVFLNNDSLANDAPLIIMLFNPTCEHCEEMAIDFRENIALFEKTNLVLVAAQGMNKWLEFFLNTTKTAAFPKIQIGIDSSHLIEQVYLYKALPQINIYNKERTLEKIFFSNVPIDSLKRYIE